MPSPKQRAVRELTLIKLGGSLITDKLAVARARPAVIARLAAEIAAARDAGSAGDLIVGHGSGSFGHPAAAAHGLSAPTAPLAPAGAAAGRRAPTAAGAAATQHAAAKLHRLVVEALVEAGVAAFSLPPSALMIADRGRPATVGLAPVEAALNRGLVPVVYGDLVLDRHHGFTVCSTEVVLRALVQRLRRRGRTVRRAIWLGDTDGVFDDDGAVIPRLDAAALRGVRRLLRAPAGTDVTGGMLLRLETARALARWGIESWVVNGTRPGLLMRALRGEAVTGTRFAADPVAS